MVFLSLAGCAASAPSKPPLQTSASSVESPPVLPHTTIEAEELDAICDPPAGWTIDPTALSSDQTRQRVWVSPSGKTSYGVIYFTLPIPVGDDIALLGFLSEMKRHEGQAALLDKQRDGDRLRFEAEGGHYHVRGIIATAGFHGWAVYAGTLAGEQPMADELASAIFARENTRLGRR